MTKRDDQFTERFKEHRRQEAEYRRQLPTDDEPPLPPPVEPIHKDKKEIGRNDACPCGSGKKYKQCCMKKDQAKAAKKK